MFFFSNISNVPINISATCCFCTLIKLSSYYELSTVCVKVNWVFVMHNIKRNMRTHVLHCKNIEIVAVFFSSFQFCFLGQPFTKKAFKTDWTTRIQPETARDPRWSRSVYILSWSPCWTHRVVHARTKSMISRLK